MDTLLREPLTTESFLAWEDGQEGKHEFDGARVIEMTGGSRAHQRLMLSLATALMARLGPEYEVLHEMRVRLGRAVRYPDVIVCRGPVDDHTKTLTDALAVLEVLSDDRAATDQGAKPTEYARLPGIRHYVLLAQDRAAVEVFRFHSPGWERQAAEVGMLNLSELKLQIPFAELYAGLRLPASGAQP